MITKTGQSHTGHQLRLEAGSDDTYRANIQSGLVFENSDLFLSITGLTSNGFRDHANQENIKFNSNFGMKLSETAETRFYFFRQHDQPGIAGNGDPFLCAERPESREIECHQ